MLRNPDLNLLFLHIPTPHPAGIWDSRDGRFTLQNADYIDNLALADKTMGHIRKLMEQLGTWDTSTVLVTSDHPYRTGMWMDSSIWTPEMARITQGHSQPYVPFFLKLANQHSGNEYTTEFNNVLSGDLALAILEGRLKTQDEAASWLNANARTSLQ
jgi:arylsulfatase A-like enzyme